MNPLHSNAAIERIRTRFSRLYPDHVPSSLNRLQMMIGRYGVGYGDRHPSTRWSEKDAVLITYGDTVRSPDATPLQTLRRFATRHFMGAFSTIHLLPFYPYSSDDGFSVIDYRKVDPDLGDWKDINSLKDHFDLMFDWVLNHVSAKSDWFRGYRNRILPYREFFIEASRESDLSQVTRPRTSPLLSAVATKTGTRHVWTTFSSDQVDLNWENPDVFFEMLDILFGYIANGARIVRLDAVAFLWKRIGTSCLHLDETHEVIRLIRDILEWAAPSVIILTETNVPHPENISYFGSGDEAHMVYQFTLPPLLLHGLLKGTAQPLTQWASQLPELPPHCTYFNFTASHDGIGIRPLEGILPDEEIAFLKQSVEERGGRLSHRTHPDGSQSVYEMNVTYFSALGEPDAQNTARGEERFLCSQIVASSLRGIPGIYFHSLCATQNDDEGVQASGIPRRINRKKWSEEELERRLNDSDTHHHRIFFPLIEILRRRSRCESFHPEGSQTILDLDERVFALIRSAPGENHHVLCLHNFSGDSLTLNVRSFIKGIPGRELISDTPFPPDGDRITLGPYQCAWIESHQD